MNILAHKISGVYQIINTVNGNCYIGSSIDIKKRWNGHRRLLERGKHHSRHLQNAWGLYSADCFRFLIIEQCDEKQLIEREQYYIDTLRPEYNILPFAGRTLGRRHTESARQKMSEARKGKMLFSVDRNQKISESLKGRKRQQKTKEKISKTLTGRVISNEWRNKISKALKGKVLSKETRKKLSDAHKGKIVSEETRRKLSEAQKGMTYSDEARQKMSDSHKGQIPWNKRKVEKEE